MALPWVNLAYRTGRRWTPCLRWVGADGAEQSKDLAPSRLGGGVVRIWHPQATRSAAPVKPATRYFIEFRARTALSYGHAYAVYGSLDVNGRMMDPHVGAIHPASNSVVPYMLGHWIPVPAEHGASDGDLEEQYVSARYRIILSEAEYNRVVAYIKELEASTPVWHAFLYSCTSFVGDVAKYMGLRTPPATMYPEVFINNLRAMNNGRDEEITIMPRVQWGLAPPPPPEQ